MLTSLFNPVPASLATLPPAAWAPFAIDIPRLPVPLLGSYPCPQPSPSSADRERCQTHSADHRSCRPPISHDQIGDWPVTDDSPSVHSVDLSRSSQSPQTPFLMSYPPSPALLSTSWDPSPASSTTPSPLMQEGEHSFNPAFSGLASSSVSTTVESSSSSVANNPQIVGSFSDSSSNATTQSPYGVFQCRYCLSTFRRRYNRNIHENSVHFKIRRFQCEDCLKSNNRMKVYSRKHDLDRHIERKHSVNTSEASSGTGAVG